MSFSSSRSVNSRNFAERRHLSDLTRVFFRCLTNLGRNKTRRENGIACLRSRYAGRDEAATSR